MRMKKLLLRLCHCWRVKLCIIMYCSYSTSCYKLMVIWSVNVNTRNLCALPYIFMCHLCYDHKRNWTLKPHRSRMKNYSANALLGMPEYKYKYNHNVIRWILCEDKSMELKRLSRKIPPWCFSKLIYPTLTVEVGNIQRLKCKSWGGQLLLGRYRIAVLTCKCERWKLTEEML